MVVVYMATASSCFIYFNRPIRYKWLWSTWLWPRLASYISTGQSDINGCGLHGYGLVLLHIFQQANPI